MNPGNKNPFLHPRDHAWWMLLIMLLFALRILAQPLALYWPSELLPAFDDWHSATLPYPALLASQLLILFTGLYLLWRLYTDRITCRPRMGVMLVRLGWIYWCIMFTRLVLGQTLPSDSHWFAQTLPALFHLLLANFVMLVGDYLRTRNKSEIPA